MYEIVTILGIIYLLYRIKFFYKEGNYNQVKGFISILNCNMKLNSIQIYNFINFFKKNIQRGSII